MIGNNSVTPGIRPRDWNYDGFFVDEFHASERDLITNCRLNRFSDTPPLDRAVRERTTSIGPGTERLAFTNPLEDGAITTIVENAGANPEAGADWWYWVYAPPSVRANPPAKIKLSLFFGPPGPVMTRQGLRAYFEGSDHVLITLAGTEYQPKFAVGITPSMIDALLTQVMGRNMGVGNWSIDVLAGYSTGFRGMNRTINSLLSSTQLQSVTRIIYYDCLYAHDRPAPGEQSFHAMDKVTSSSAAAKIVVYEVSGNITDLGAEISGGTPRKTNNAYWTRWPAEADPLSNTNKRTLVHNLRGPVTNQMISLGLARLFESALENGYFDRDFVRSTFGTAGGLLVDVIDSQLKPRGQYCSSAQMAAGKTLLARWLSVTEANRLANLAMTRMIIEPKTSRDSPGGFLNDPRFSLLGWVGAPGVLDVSHDTQVPEFAWEHLLGG